MKKNTLLKEGDCR